MLLNDPRKGRQKELEDQREAYEGFQTSADKAYKEYDKLYKQAVALIGDAQRTLRGYHGLRSDDLKDYGFTPPKPGGRRGPRVKKGVKANK